ncbi:hypothetical protein [Mycolicibacterium lacusdiani]|uniref:hypothetical protein n=1 Tax=Mycolicibacterium lacusdiani TaxID=2895283 RepID=UPI001F20F4FA|nr:hypothetical protein [Mycolicibacterium lacusdiani]
MRRWIAILWHASFLVIAGGLYFFFVLPRWYELTGEWNSTLGTAMRILCAVLIGLAALPVVFTWLRSRKPEYGTPQLALTLRVGSIALHVLAALLIAGAAVSEIWLSLDEVGQWLFGVYGAAAAIALLGALAFYLAYLAELPPPPPKPLKTKPKASSRGRGRGKDAASAPVIETADTETTEVTDASADETPAETESADTEADATAVTAATDGSDETAPDADGNAGELESDKDSGESGGRLRNRRATGKPSSGLFRRNRGGVALDD